MTWHNYYISETAKLLYWVQIENFSFYNCFNEHKVLWSTVALTVLWVTVVVTGNVEAGKQVLKRAAELKILSSEQILSLSTALVEDQSGSIQYGQMPRVYQMNQFCLYFMKHIVSVWIVQCFYYWSNWQHISYHLISNYCCDWFVVYLWTCWWGLAILYILHYTERLVDATVNKHCSSSSSAFFYTVSQKCAKMGICIFKGHRWHLFSFAAKYQNTPKNYAIF